MVGEWVGVGGDGTVDGGCASHKPGELLPSMFIFGVKSDLSLTGMGGSSFPRHAPASVLTKTSSTKCSSVDQTRKYS